MKEVIAVNMNNNEQKCAKHGERTFPFDCKCENQPPSWQEEPKTETQQILEAYNNKEENRKIGANMERERLAEEIGKMEHTNEDVWTWYEAKKQNNF